MSQLTTTIMLISPSNNYIHSVALFPDHLLLCFFDCVRDLWIMYGSTWNRRRPGSKAI